MNQKQGNKEPIESGCQQCACGYSVGDPWVTETPEYSRAAWIVVLMGISALPRAVLMRCAQCGHVFSRSESMKDRERIRYL